MIVDYVQNVDVRRFDRIVYILDDDKIVRSSLAFFCITAGFKVVTFASSEAFLAEIDTLEPGCVLLDIRMPIYDGFHVLKCLSRRRLVLPTVMMAGHGDVITAVRSIKLGAFDFIEKPFEEESMMETLNGVFSGLEVDRRVSHRQECLRARLERLTVREREVLGGLIAGRPNKLIAYDLSISVRTVEMHRAALMERLGVRSLAETICMAIEGGLGSPIGVSQLTA